MARGSKEEDSTNDLAILDKLDSLEQIQTLLDSGAIPSSLDTPQKVLTVIQTGKEMGMQPMTALNNIYVIQGRTVISSTMLGALLKVRNIEFVWTKDYFTEEDGKVNTELEFEFISRVSGQPKTAKFAISWTQMEIAGYTDKQNWQKYPKEMMRARCMAYAVRALFPEVLLGFYTDSEIVDSMDTNHTTTVDEEGTVVILPADED
jgi:hypothetical protein